MSYAGLKLAKLVEIHSVLAWRGVTYKAGLAVFALRQVIFGRKSLVAFALDVKGRDKNGAFL